MEDKYQSNIKIEANPWLLNYNKTLTAKTTVDVCHPQRSVSVK